MYRAWVALRDAESGEESGVQGFLKLTVTVLGPGDRQRVHDLAEEMQVGFRTDRAFFQPFLSQPTHLLRRECRLSLRLGVFARALERVVRHSVLCYEHKFAPDTYPILSFSYVEVHANVSPRAQKYCAPPREEPRCWLTRPKTTTRLC